MSAIDELEPFDQAFVYEYVKDFNGTRAVQRAGHSGNDNVLAVTASRLLRNVKITAAIKEQLDAKAMSADEVLYRYARFARAEYARYIQKNGRVNIRQMVLDGNADLIKRIKETQHGLDIEFQDPKSSLDSLAKYHNLLDAGSSQEKPLFLNIAGLDAAIKKAWGDDNSKS